MAWQFSWLECRPVTAEVVGSNPIQVAIWIATVIQCADVAQLAEQLICNQQVVGSSPIISSKSNNSYLCGCGSVVEHRLAKARVASSNLVIRSTNSPDVPNNRCLVMVFFYMRVQLSGRAPAFQAGCEGSIPFTRSKLLIVFQILYI